MSATTEETWKVNGTLLNTYAYNIETLNGREGIPPRRGQNVVIPFKPGRLWVPKIPDERPLTLAMWVNDADVDGVYASTEVARRAQLRDNTQAIKDLFGTFGTLCSLEKKVRRGAGLKTYTGQAECVGVLPFQYEDLITSFARVVVDLVMPDPYWYDGATPVL